MKLINGILCGFIILGLAGCSWLPDRTGEEIASRYPQVREIKTVALTEAAPEPLAEPNRIRIEPGKKVSLSIEQSRALALQNNLQLRVQVFNPRIARESINEADSAFEPLFLSQFNYITTDTPVSLTLDASQSTVSYTNNSLVIPLRTGGRISMNMPWQRNKTDNLFATLNPSYSSDFSLSLSQELLRGAGLSVNEYAIRVRQLESEQVMARTQAEAARVLAAVDRAYWRLYAAHRALEVRRMEYDLAAAQLERAQRMVNLNEAREIEVVRAEAAAAQRLEGIIVADNELRDRERELKVVLNAEGLEMESATVLLPETQPGSAHYVVDRERMLEEALGCRMDLIELELQLTASESSLKYSRNGLLPLLTLDYTYNINGLGPTSDDAVDLMLENRFVDHRIGLVLQVPLGNEAARSRYRQAQLKKRQLLANRELVKNQVKREVLAAADQLESNWQRVMANRTNSELAKRNLEAEQRQFELGMQYSTEVLNAQTRYADALLSEITALAEYQIAQVDLCYAVGGLNQTARVVWDNKNDRFAYDNE